MKRMRDVNLMNETTKIQNFLQIQKQNEFNDFGELKK